MKTSHYITPRSLDACQFAHNADPMEYAPRGFDPADKIVLTACAIAAIALAVVLYVF
jgi:hypothetical protein